MVNKVPLWANTELSRNLPEIRSKGEGINVEFKERIPEQAQRLGKELAALGTSGGGAVYLGINDNGELVGLDASDGEARDDIALRVQGIVQSIKPALRVEILFAVDNDKTILVVRIPQQEEPVYYYEDRPYIRDGRMSRPATPQEVKDRILSHPSDEFKREEERIEIQRKRALANAEVGLYGQRL